MLRNNLYTDYQLQAVQQALTSGQLVNARGDGATSIVTREDCARAAASALVESASGRHIFEITGPAAVTSAQLAAIASELSGRPITHVSVSPDALRDGMVPRGLPGPIADLLVSFEVAIARGDLAPVSDAVLRLTGRAPQAVRESLAPQVNAPR